MGYDKKNLYVAIKCYDSEPGKIRVSITNRDQCIEDDWIVVFLNIFRIKADVLKESYIGFCLTDRQINGSYNRVAGIDGQLKFNNKFFFNFQALASKTKLTDTETDIVPALYGEFFYYSKHWGGGIFSQAMHPDFEASSGYVNRVDYKSYGAFTLESTMTFLKMSLGVSDRRITACLLNFPTGGGFK